MKIFILFGLVLALAFANAGLDSLRRLRRMLVPADAYFQTEGTVLKVEQEVFSGAGPGDRDASGSRIYQISYTFQVSGVQRTANSLSPSCDLCDANDVRAMTGKLPSQMVPGERVRVYIKKDAPFAAYLALASAAEIRSQMWFVFKFLIVAPIFCAVGGFLLASKKTTGSTE